MHGIYIYIYIFKYLFDSKPGEIPPLAYGYHSRRFYKRQKKKPVGTCTIILKYKNSMLEPEVEQGNDVTT